MPKNQKDIMLELLSRKHGATIDNLAVRFRVEPKKIRNIVDSLRRSGHSIENTGPGRVKYFTNN